MAISTTLPSQTINISHDQEKGRVQIHIHGDNREADISFDNAQGWTLGNRLAALKQAQEICLSLKLHKPAVLNFGSTEWICPKGFKIVELVSLANRWAMQLEEYELPELVVRNFPVSRAHAEELLGLGVPPHRDHATASLRRQVKAFLKNIQD